MQILICVRQTWISYLKEKQRAKKSKGLTSINGIMLSHWKPSNLAPVFIKESGSTDTITQSAETHILPDWDGERHSGINHSHINPIPTNKLTSPSTTDKTATPCVSEWQSQHKALTPLKPLPSPCLSSRPKRIVRPSLSSKESLGLCWTFGH